MIRTIIHIDRDKCNGCGLCAEACHEGAIEMVDGKAMLTREDYCDGLGDCLPGCPTGAITFEQREAPAYDEAAVLAAKAAKAAAGQAPAHTGCPGSMSRTVEPARPAHSGCPGSASRSIEKPSLADIAAAAPAEVPGMLKNWPVQIKLAPTSAPYFDNANLLIAADCTAFTYGNFHDKFIKNRVCLIGCPKLDAIDYSEKLTAIIANNNIRSITIVRMEVPCCGGLENAAKKAIQASGKFLPWRVVTVNIDGSLRDD